MTSKEAAALISNWDNVLIITHRRPDGDTVGSAAALCAGLRCLGKTAYILENPDATSRYLEYYAPYLSPNGFEPDRIIVVDTATEDLFPEGGEKWAKRTDLCIDHHLTNGGYAINTLLRADYAACGELIYEILMELCKNSLTVEMANAVYLAVSTDTGCFRYSNTTSNTLRVAAAAKDFGADTYAINKIMFSTRSFPRLRLESMLFSNIDLHHSGKTAVMTLTNQMMTDSDAGEDDAEDLSGIPRTIEGVTVGVLIRELKNGSSRISVRTGGDPNASDICRVLGGGGHKGAAGVTLDLPVGQAKERILDAISSVLNR